MTRLPQLLFITLLFLPAPVLSDVAAEYLCNGGKDRSGNALQSPTLEQTREIHPQTRNQLSASSLLKLAHQCSLETSRHADLLFRATEAMGCGPESLMARSAINTANHADETNYKVAVLFRNARQNSAEDVDAVCDEIAKIDPDEIDVMSLEDATALGRRLGEFEVELRALWHGK